MRYVVRREEKTILEGCDSKQTHLSKALHARSEDTGIICRDDKLIRENTFNVLHPNAALKNFFPHG